MPLPSREDLRRDLDALDATHKKLIGGVLAVMFQHPARVKDREWIVEQFTQVTLLAAEAGDLGPAFDEARPAHEGLAVVEAFVRDHVDTVLNASFALFVHVAEDMRQRGDSSLGVQDAMLQALGYFTP